MDNPESESNSENESKPSNKKKSGSVSPLIMCVIITVITLVGALISLVSHNVLWILLFMLPAVIYELIRTEPGASTKVSSAILLVVVILEIILVLFNVNFNLVTFLGYDTTYVAGYLLPLGDIKVFGPILAIILSLILLVRTYGPYTRYLSIVIAIASLAAVFIIDPTFFQSVVKLIFEGILNQVGNY